jgi:hypothetical protein
MTQISVTRALAQVKSLNDRITRGTAVPFIGVLVGGKHNSGKPAQEVNVTLNAALQSVTGMILQRKALKAAIVRSNAVTNVSIGNVSMTVAEAIERKSSVVLEQALLAALKSQVQQVNASVERTNVDVRARMEKLLETAVGKDRKVDESELAAITDPFKATNEAVALDPNNLPRVIETLQADIDSFLEEVDFALSEVNATTLIEV